MRVWQKRTYATRSPRGPPSRSPGPQPHLSAQGRRPLRHRGDKPAAVPSESGARWGMLLLLTREGLWGRGGQGGYPFWGLATHTSILPLHALPHPPGLSVGHNPSLCSVPGSCSGRQGGPRPREGPLAGWGGGSDSQLASCVPWELEPAGSGWAQPPLSPLDGALGWEADTGPRLPGTDADALDGIPRNRHSRCQGPASLTPRSLEVDAGGRTPGPVWLSLRYSGHLTTFPGVQKTREGG